MRALITGVDGFVGRYLWEYLVKQGVEVFGTTLFDYDAQKENNIYKMDLLNREEVDSVLKRVVPDHIYHLAGQSNVGLSWDNPTLTMNVNVNGSVNLLEAVKENCIHAKVLIIGSSDEYGAIKQEQCPISEEHILKPINPYAVSKMAQEEMARVYAKAYDLKIIMVRPFNHIGAGQSTGFVIPDFASRIVEIEREISTSLKVGNLEAYRDFSDVRDIVRGYHLLMSRGKIGEVYNIGSGKAYKIQDLLDILISLSDKRIKVEEDIDKLRPSDIPIIQCDNSKISRDTGFVPIYDIRDTLKDVLEYFREINK